MSNPRKVNWLQDPAFTPQDDAVLPAIPEIHSEDRELQAGYGAMKRNIEVLRGVPGLPGEAAVRKGDLQALGLSGDLSAEVAAPSDLTGVAVWAGGSRRFQLLTPEALAKALRAFLTFESEVTLDEFVSLRQAVAAVEPGVTHHALQQQLNILATQLSASWRRELDAAMQGSAAYMAALQDNVAATRGAIERASRGLLFEITTAAAVWTITHGLERYVDVTVLDDDGEKRMAKVVYDSVNKVTITHSRAMTGKVLVK